MSMKLGSSLLLVTLALGLSACGSDDSGAEQTGGPQTPTGPTPKPEFLPEPTGACPGFADGAGCTKDDKSLICTFSPAGIVPRRAQLLVTERLYRPAATSNARQNKNGPTP